MSGGFTPRDVELLTEDMARVFGPSAWWKFYGRWRTKAMALDAILWAFSGDVGPIKAFGILIPRTAETPYEKWVSIQQQTVPLHRKFRKRLAK